MKFAFWKDINKADAILTISDPNFDFTTRKTKVVLHKNLNESQLVLKHGALSKLAIVITVPNYYYGSL